MKIKKTLLATSITTALLSGGALAEPPSYTYLEAGGFRANFDEVDIDPTGFYIAGSAALTNTLFLRGLYAEGDDDLDLNGGDIEVDVEDFRVGLGLKQNINDYTSWFLAADYLEPEADVGGFKADENGWSLSAGVRGFVAEGFELFGELGYADVDEADGFIGNLGVVYSVYEGLGIVAKAEVDEDKNSTISAGLRYSF